MSTTVSLWRDIGRNDDEQEKGLPPKHTFATILPRWYAVTKLWFTGNDRHQAWSFVGAAIGINVLYTLLLVQVSYVQRDLNTAMSDKQIDAFYKSVWSFVVIICVAAPLFALNLFVEARLSLAWRSYLVKYLLSIYFQNKSFFHLTGYADRLDNPDQRICDDVQSFVASSVFLTLNLSRKLFNCIAFTGVLWAISPSVVLFTLLYAIGGTVMTGTIFGKPLMRLNFQVLHREGDLRYSLVRVRENAESIAFYNGQEQEHSTSKDKFDRVCTTRIRRINWDTGLEFWQNMYSYATILAPSLLMAPRYFAGEVKFGVIAQTDYAFGKMTDALTTFVENFSDLSSLSAQTERLVTLIDLIQRTAAETSHDLDGSRIKRDQLRSPITLQINALDFKTPGGQQLIASKQDLALYEGESLLVMGPSGCGKSSLLRVMAGLWSRGKGMVSLPPDDRVFFLPQKPYMPLGTLRTQLTFPDIHRQDIADAKLEELLKEVRLGHILERFGGLDAEIDWAQVLSLGEQQRVAFLRLFLFAPGFAILDEATSALDLETEHALYSRLRTLCTSYISVGHRHQLMEYHTHVLQFVGDGKWVKKRTISGENPHRERHNLLLE